MPGKFAGRFEQPAQPSKFADRFESAHPDDAPAFDAADMSGTPIHWAASALENYFTDERHPDDAEVSGGRALGIAVPRALGFDERAAEDASNGRVPLGLVGKVDAAALPEPRPRAVIEDEARRASDQHPFIYRGSQIATLVGPEGARLVESGPGAVTGALASRAEARSAELGARATRAAELELLDETRAGLPAQRRATTEGNRVAASEFKADTASAKRAAQDATLEARDAAAAEARTPTQDKSLAIYGLEDSPGQRHVRDPLEAAEQGRTLYAEPTPGNPSKPLHETLLEMPAEARARYALANKGDQGAIIGGFRNGLAHVDNAFVNAPALKSSVRRALVDLPQELKTEEVSRLYQRIDDATKFKEVRPAELRDLIEETERLANATSDQALRRAYYSVRKVLVDREKTLIVRHFPVEAPQYLDALEKWQLWDDVAFGSRRLLEKGNRLSTAQAPSADLVNWPAPRDVAPTRPREIPRPERVGVEVPEFSGGAEAEATARAELQPSLARRAVARAARVASALSGGAAAPGARGVGAAVGAEIGRPLSEAILARGTPTSAGLMEQSAKAGDFAARLREIAGAEAPGIQATLERIAEGSPAKLAATIAALDRRYPGLQRALAELPEAADSGEQPAEPAAGPVVKSDARAKERITPLDSKAVLRRYVQTQAGKRPSAAAPARARPAPAAAPERSEPRPAPRAWQPAPEERAGLGALAQESSTPRPKPKRVRLRVTKRDEKGDILEMEREEF